MASTLSLLNLPILKPSKLNKDSNFLQINQKLFNPSNSISSKLNKDSNFLQINPKLFNPTSSISSKLNKDSNFIEFKPKFFNPTSSISSKLNKDSNFIQNQQNGKFKNLESLSFLPLTATTLYFFLDANEAFAAGGEYGIFEGRSFALIHPIVMGGLFVYTLYAGYLGWQWRRVRTLQEEIGELKKEVKAVPVTPDGKSAEEVPKASPVEIKIQQLSEERKELLKGSYRDKHFNAGSILLAFGVLESVGGGVNTWLRTGKLFPGPHLFAGAGITVLWAAAAALVPAMQKGNETARSLHIALNAINVALFVWQIPTGIDIVFKVFEFTKWP